MILPNPKDAIHKAWLYRVLTAIADNHRLAQSLMFKGGTCAAMRGWLDRFSIDLDFDYGGTDEDMGRTQKELEKIFLSLGLIIKDRSQVVPQYFLRYPNQDKNQRNTLKIDITTQPPRSNTYEAVRLQEIDRIINCHTRETMFANKLVALLDRFEKNHTIAGRDLYDIHYFFISGFRYEKKVILERRISNKSLTDFFVELIEFIKKEITETIINQDINVLLPYKKFKAIRKSLKPEVLMFLNDELARLRNEK